MPSPKKETRKDLEQRLKEYGILGVESMPTPALREIDRTYRIIKKGTS